METVQLSDVSDPSSDILAVALDNVTFEVVDENYEIILESPEIAPPPEHPGNGLAEGVHHPVPLDNVVDIDSQSAADIQADKIAFAVLSSEHSKALEQIKRLEQASKVMQTKNLQLENQVAKGTTNIPIS